MTLLAEFPSVDAAQERAERAFRWPVGAVSPLWAVFGAAASVGVAYWWIKRWTEAANVEAFAGALGAPAVKLALAPVEVVTEPPPEPTVETLEPVVAETPVAAEPVAAPAPEPVAALAPDDLTHMTGIGPKLSAALAERGVTRFAQIAAWTADDLAEVDAALSLKGRAVREAWVAQARRLAANAAA